MWPNYSLRQLMGCYGERAIPFNSVVIEKLSKLL